MNNVFDSMRLGIPSLLKTGTIDTIRVPKKIALSAAHLLLL